MWICLNNAFISAVQDENDANMLKIRARNRAHLKALFPKAKIFESSDTDYRFRVFIPRERFATLLAKKAMEINYPNFKDSVRDDKLHDLYASFWTLHWRYQRALNQRAAKNTTPYVLSDKLKESGYLKIEQCAGNRERHKSCAEFIILMPFKAITKT